MKKADKLEKKEQGKYKLDVELDLDVLKGTAWEELSAAQKDRLTRLACEQAGLLKEGKVK